MPGEYQQLFSLNSQLASRIAQLEKEVERLHAVEGPLPRIGFSYQVGTNQIDLATGSQIKVEYDTEIFDYGGAFNATTNTFTSPVDGMYILTAYVRLRDVDSAATSVEFRIITPVEDFKSSLTPEGFDQDCDFVTMQTTGIVRLTVGMTAFVTIDPTGGAAQMDIIQGLGSRFMGWLIG